MKRKRITQSEKESIVLLVDGADGEYRCGFIVYWTNGRVSQRQLYDSDIFPSEREAIIRTLKYLMTFRSYYLDETVEDLQKAHNEASQLSIFDD